MSYSKTFITDITKFALLDNDGHIRAVAMDLCGICRAKADYGWGRIFRCEYDNEKGILKIGEQIE